MSNETIDLVAALLRFGAYTGYDNEATEVMREAAAMIDRLRSALAGEVGLVQLLTARDDLRPEREAILSNHRHVEALDALHSMET